MAFWTNSGNTEPKRNFRFQVSMTGLNEDKGGTGTNAKATQQILWWAKKVTKPNFTIAEGKHVYLGHTFYYPGKVEWQEISMTLVDPVTPNASAIFMDMVAKSGYVLPKKPDGQVATVATLGKKGFVDSAKGIGEVVITQLDHEGGTVEQWTLHGTFFKSLKFGDLDYENDDLSNIEVGLRYDWAECNTGGSDFFAINS